MLESNLNLMGKGIRLLLKKRYCGWLSRARSSFCFSLTEGLRCTSHDPLIIKHPSPYLLTSDAIQCSSIHLFWFRARLDVNQLYASFIFLFFHFPLSFPCTSPISFWAAPLVPAKQSSDDSLPPPYFFLSSV
ncbi:hypothetical protein CLIB1423_13S03862 [[Candida] railenensis]|uniref:Uncharacterized protein n=1 Tax=[Candida] railenensis TaxID=45579 RepID=A0A9P0QR64_9ASCO|nr:hypothetical protein CLIB1423_13S03862 [[Candida] railenensis]